MRVRIRKTMNGVEYWDTEEKRSILVPAGQDPGFEYETDPVTMLEEKPVKAAAAEADPDSIDDGPSIDNAEQPKEDKKDVSHIVSQEEELDAALKDEDMPDLSGKTIKELKEFAAKEEIDIPTDIKKRDAIIDHLYDQLMERQMAD